MGEISDAELVRLRQENARLTQALAECQASQRWIESRVADLLFEVRSLRERLAQSQDMRRVLESNLAGAGAAGNAPER